MSSGPRKQHVHDAPAPPGRVAPIDITENLTAPASVLLATSDRPMRTHDSALVQLTNSQPALPRAVSALPAFHVHQNQTLDYTNPMRGVGTRLRDMYRPLERYVSTTRDTDRPLERERESGTHTQAENRESGIAIDKEYG